MQLRPLQTCIVGTNHLNSFEPKQRESAGKTKMDDRKDDESQQPFDEDNINEDIENLKIALQNEKARLIYVF